MKAKILSFMKLDEQGRDIIMGAPLPLPIKRSMNMK